MVSQIQIAKTAHAIHRAYCLEMNIPTQPHWDLVDNEHKEVVYNSIRHILAGNVTNVIDSHNAFVESKIASGWSYGNVYSLEKKENPRLVNFELLTTQQRIKEALFFECICSFK